MAEISIRVANDLICYICFQQRTEPDDVRQLYRRYGDLARDRRFRASIWDLRLAKGELISARLRKVAAESYQEVKAIVDATEVVAGRVVASRTLWGVVTAFDWLVGGFDYPVKNFLELHQAEKYVVSQLQSRGIDVPPGTTASN